ncbi:thioredoxin-dependent thiol peroxidase [Paenibacillus tarimensis]|uniref:thioredoxin-dependent thiol peroxidase n=1 Tax=Paenibacillus tarimensis TaxID=416012 RepID=UPI001F454200|nr:thioredoxin-dependent thiol peroxidase [Paenibacillus tarimensis]MCF2944953.1 thioredoxin-dependent thiol peroxidase [Paenibacillus tarimensis]
MSTIIGAPAPDFTLPAPGGKQVTLSELRGNHVLLYFYPKDMTPGCTTQACDLRDRHPEVRGLNTVVLGVSPDPVKRHETFAAKHELPFTLLSDENHEVSELYGVWKLKQMYGKQFMGIERSTFLIDQSGILVREWRKVKVAGHADEVVKAIRELEA